MSLAYRESDMAIGDVVLEPETVFSTLKGRTEFQNFNRKRIFLF